MQQADRQWKNRPALLLCRVPHFDDLLLWGITTQWRGVSPGTMRAAERRPLGNH